MVESGIQSYWNRIVFQCTEYRAEVILASGIRLLMSQWEAKPVLRQEIDRPHSFPLHGGQSPSLSGTLTAYVLNSTHTIVDIALCLHRSILSILTLSLCGKLDPLVWVPSQTNTTCKEIAWIAIDTITACGHLNCHMSERWTHYQIGKFFQGRFT